MAAMALPVALLALALPASATGGATDDSGVAAAGDSFTSFPVTSNDAGYDDLNGDFVQLNGSPDPAFTANGSEIDLDLSSVASAGTLSVGYDLVDGTDGTTVKGTATLTVKVVTRNLQLTGGDQKVTVSWPGLPAGITALHISYDTVPLSDHTTGTHVTNSGTGPVDIAGLTNGLTYHFYVTPQYNGADLQNGETGSRTPRATNTPPVATDDTVSLTTDNPIDFFPTSNDNDADGDDLALTSHSTPAHGTVQCDVSGFCSYTPTGARQNDSMTYTIADGYGGTDSATVTFVARNVTANPDPGNTTNIDEQTVIDVLANDTGVLASDQVVVTGVTGTNPNCVTTDVDSQRRIVASGAIVGSCTIDYQIQTDDGRPVGNSTAAVTVGPKRPLVANDDDVDTAIGATANFEVYDNDQFTVDTADPNNSFPLKSGAGFTEITAAPTHGTATLDFVPRYLGPHDELRNVPVIHYVPAAHYKGTDQLTYRLADTHGHSDTAVVHITTSAHAPHGGFANAGIGTASLQWSNPTFPPSPDFNDVTACFTVGATRTAFPPDPTLNADGSCATGTAVTALGSGTPQSVTMSGLTNDVRYRVGVFAHYNDGTANGAWSDPDIIGFMPGADMPQVTWYDGGNAVSGDPHQKSHFVWTNAAGSTGTTIAWSSVDFPSIPDADANHATFASGVTQGDVDMPAGDWHVSVFGTATGTFSDPDNVDVKVAAGNNAPVANTDTATATPRGRFVTTNVLTNDSQGGDTDPWEVKSYTQPSQGSVSCFGSSCFYHANETASGTDHYTYTVGDHRYGVSTATVNVPILQNRPPQAFSDFWTFTQNKPVTLKLSQEASDPDTADTLTYSVVGTPPASLHLSCSSSTGDCSLNPDTVGDFSFVFKVNDGHVDSNQATQSLHIVANQSPSTSDLDKTVTKDATTPIAIDLTAGTTDPDDAKTTLTYSVTSPPQKGTATCGGSLGLGKCTYLPNTGAVGEDSFSFEVDDPHGGKTWGSVDVQIQAINHPPATTGYSGLTTNNATALPIDLSTHATDQDGDTLTYTVVTGVTSAMGTLSCNGTGSCTYTPNPAFVGTASFTFRVNDGTVNSNTSTVSIGVTQANRPPTGVVDRLAQTRTLGTVHVNVAAGVTDPDGDALTFAKASDPTKGTASCTTAGDCTYTATTAAAGDSDTFNYSVDDGHGHVVTKKVDVTITANNAPVAGTDTPSVMHDSVNAPISVAANDTDADSDPLTWDFTGSTPAHGTLSGCDASTGVCQYTPTAGYVGPDTYAYTVTDHIAAPVTGTVNITVTRSTGSGTIVLTGPVNRSVKSALVLSGTMTPKAPGTTLTLQRKSGTSWLTVKTLAESSTGGYRFSVLQPTGSFTFRVSAPQTALRTAFVTPTKAAGFYAVSLPSSATTGNEYVTIKNTGTVSFNLSRWTITTKAGKVFTLPSKALAPGKSVKVHPGFGTTTSTDIYLKKTRTAFAAHDTLRLKDYPLKAVVATRTF